jgi:Glycosyl transferase family 21
VSEAPHEIVVISDSEVRVRPDYLRTVVAPLADSQVGAVTRLYPPLEEKTLADNVQTIGMVADFYAGLMAGWQLNGVKFALEPTIATMRARAWRASGGHRAIANQPGDDALVGRLIAEQGHQVRPLPDYPIRTVADYQSIRELLHKRMRRFVVMRHLQPWDIRLALAELSRKFVARGGSRGCRWPKVLTAEQFPARTCHLPRQNKRHIDAENPTRFRSARTANQPIRASSESNGLRTA